MSQLSREEKLEIKKEYNKTHAEYQNAKIRILKYERLAEKQLLTAVQLHKLQQAKEIVERWMKEGRITVRPQNSNKKPSKWKNEAERAEYKRAWNEKRKKKEDEAFLEQYKKQYEE